MKREIHAIFDVILKLIISAYAPEFLKLIREDKSIKKVLRNEFITKKGRNLYLDFLCELEDKTLLNIEFQFTGPDKADLDRFFDYNLASQSEYDQLCETIVIIFRTSTAGQKTRKIGKSKSIHPIFFYLGDIDFVKKLNTIENKIENNIKLTGIEEILLMLMCLLPKYKNKQKILKRICNIHKKQELFDITKINTFEAVIGLEIKNFVETEEQENLFGELNMSPESEKIMEKAIHEAIRKRVHLEKEQSYKEGIKEGIKEGKKENNIEIAKKLKEYLTPEEIKKITGLTTSTILKL